MGHLARSFPRFTAWLLFLASEAIYVGMLRLPDAREHLAAYLLLAGAAGLLALLAAPILSGRRAAVLVGCAIVFRATLLLRAPDLSDDAYRYLWDARVAAAGVSPWARSPDDPAFDRLDPALRQRVAHREIRTVYPPAAQAAFRVGSLGGESLLGLKALLSAADVAIVWLLALRGLSGAAALYAFHPLPVLEVAGQGHVDSLGAALLLASLSLLAARRPLSAGMAFALSALTKYVSLAALLPVARAGRWRSVLAATVAGGAVWLSASRGGVSPAGGLSEYATRWEFNAVFYPAVRDAVAAIDLPERAKSAFLDAKARWEHPAWMETFFPYFYDAFFARAILGVLLLAALVGIAWRVRDLRAAVFASLGALLLLAPTLHPWYLLWILPLAAERREAAFLYLSFAIPLSYGLLHPLPGIPRAAILAVEYVPFAVLLAASFRTARRRAAATAEARA